jgi:glutaredoxin 2
MYSSRKEDGITCNLSDFSAQSSFDFFRNKKVYIFTPFTKLGTTNAESIKNIQKFVEHSKTLVQDHYRHLTKKKLQSA